MFGLSIWQFKESVIGSLLQSLLCF